MYTNRSVIVEYVENLWNKIRTTMPSLFLWLLDASSIASPSTKFINWSYPRKVPVILRFLFKFNETLLSRYDLQKEQGTNTYRHKNTAQDKYYAAYFKFGPREELIIFASFSCYDNLTSSKALTSYCMQLPEEAPKNFRNGTSSMHWSNDRISLTPAGWCNCWGNNNGRKNSKSLRKGKRSLHHYKDSIYDWYIHSCIWLPIVSLARTSCLDWMVNNLTWLSCYDNLTPSKSWVILHAVD